MNFTEFLREQVIANRLKEHRILVVFDPDQRFELLCQSLAGAHCHVLSTVKRPVSARMELIEEWKKLCQDTTLRSQLLVYSTDEVPLSDEAKRSHPLTAFVTTGSQFPAGPKDDYRQLCYRFLPNRRTEIDQLFAASEPPSIEHINSLAGGAHSHPRLEKMFATGEVTKILKSFLVPSAAVKEDLEGGSDWCDEFRQLTERTLGFRCDPRATQAGTIRSKLWQYLLFSEFAADLPCALPESLSGIPHASGTAVPVVMQLCEELRSTAESKDAYREAATTIEADLDLRNECEAIGNLGDRDTFAFEEVKFLNQAVTAVRSRLLDDAKGILEVHRKSLWTEEGERQLLWRIVDLGLETLGAIKMGRERLLMIGGTGAELCRLYEEDLSRVDRFQRELENAVSQTDQGYEEIEDAVALVRGEYRQFFNTLQEQLLKAIQQEGWPLSGLRGNADTYDEVVAPLLKEGKRVAYFMVDALRLELAQKLAETLSGEFPAKVSSQCAQLPCVTRFGMASLLPEASQKLRYEVNGGDLQPTYDEVVVSARSKRLDVFTKVLSDRVECCRLDQLLKDTKGASKLKSRSAALKQRDLLVITSTELDESGESALSLRQHLPSIMDQILRAVRRCAEMGFEHAVMATDHGFLWLDDLDSGSVCTKPQGDWVLQKRRCLLGKGDEAQGSIRFSSSALSIPTDEPSFVVPRQLGVYSRGNEYFHEGISLQESLLPVMEVELGQAQKLSGGVQATELELTRKKKRVTSLIVSVNLSWPGDLSLLGETQEFDVLATQNKQVVAAPTSSKDVDTATSRVRLGPGTAIKVSLRLNENAEEGPFRVEVRDLKTEKALATLELNYEPIV